MGEVTELVLEGYLCQDCGGFVSEIGSGYPRSCNDCEEEED